MSSNNSWSTNSEVSNAPSSDLISSQDLKRSESMIPKEPVLHTCFFDSDSPTVTVSVDSRNNQPFENQVGVQAKTQVQIKAKTQAQAQAQVSSPPGYNGMAMRAGYSLQRQPNYSYQKATIPPSAPAPVPVPISLSPSHMNSAKECDSTDQLLDTLQYEGISGMKSHADLAKTAHSVRILAKRLDKATIHLQMNNVMIITKARDNSLIYLTRELAEWLLKRYQKTTVYVDYHLEHSHRFNFEALIADVTNGKERLKCWTKKLALEKPDLFDFVITLGGDGTVLYASTLFQKVVPPIISFSLGSLGFLTNFQFEDFRTTLDLGIKLGVKTNLRMRFTCRVHDADGALICEQQVLNELTVDRGPSPFVTMLELYGDGSLITVAQADGLIIATPTGSTAYSLSAGGSLVHPSVSTICVTPICPHTLSFRPILLPDSMVLKIKVPLRARSHAWASFDGRERTEMSKGYYVTVSASQYPFPTVRSSKSEYFESVCSVLNWNKREEQKSFVHLLSDKNKKSYNDYRESHERRCLDHDIDQDGEGYNYSHSDDPVSAYSSDVRDEHVMYNDKIDDVVSNGRYEIDYSDDLDDLELEDSLSNEVKGKLKIGMADSFTDGNKPQFYTGDSSVSTSSGSSSPL
ncbi:hypothetical protein FOA43_003363 [Brettanomyces nanus]|uniref:NAD(+) kinase n=1 Tax=Eeniella nana TaxID=13502 RepID=A0A875RW15_EENNA|nr:uncharacterized protein FOA43_003363 [Brettanomyces nanus]QPG75977.1 hypothetical protein FOA43_003363 [Brettanomyces nanus]